MSGDSPWPWILSVIAHLALLGLVPCEPGSPRAELVIESVELVLLEAKDADRLRLEAAFVEAGANIAPTQPTLGKVPDSSMGTNPTTQADTRTDDDAVSTAPSRLRPADSASRPDHSRQDRVHEDPVDIDPPEPLPPKTPEPEVPSPEPSEHNRYVHAPESQEDAAASDRAPISSADRAADDLQRTSVLSRDEGTYAPFQQAGQSGGVAGTEPEEDGQERDPTPSTSQHQSAARLGTPDGQDPPPAPTDAAVAEQVARARSQSQTSTLGSSQPSHAPVASADGREQSSIADVGEDVPAVPTPDWWEAGASRAATEASTSSPSQAARNTREGIENGVEAAVPVEDVRPETSKPPQTGEDTEEEDGTDAETTTVAQSDTTTPDSQEASAPRGIRDGQVDGTPEGAAEEAEQAGERQTPLAAPTDLFRDSMGWTAGSSPGRSTAGAPSASELVASEDEAEAAVAAVETRQTPRGVYSAHVERSLMEQWYAKDLSLDQRALGARGEVTVLFRIRRSGRVADLVLIRSSGDPHIDHLALQAVPKRFSRFPSTLRERFLLFEWTFHYRN